MSLQTRLDRLSNPAALPLLRKLQRGIEKESLRVDSQGRISRASHPDVFGSALTHPLITTDFSEALLEIVTPVTLDAEAAMNQLDLIHRYICTSVVDEELWSASMPGTLAGDEDIPIARYGNSNPGRFKYVYRQGLSHRYGRRMQAIAGIHYNFSVPQALWPHLGCSSPDDINEAYFRLIRNFHGMTWVLAYLFGASPALCRSFVNTQEHSLESLSANTIFLPHATSLRMGNLGYRSNAGGLTGVFDSLPRYITGLASAILQPSARYQHINLTADEDHPQLSTALLQTENEFYSPIRPKRVPHSGESTLAALARGGVEYVEIRCLDVNPYLSHGIDAQQIRFLDALLMLCLLKEEDTMGDRAYLEAQQNLHRVVHRGREPGLWLKRDGIDILMQQWACEILEQVYAVGTLLDQAEGTDLHTLSVETQRAKVLDPSLTPSAQILRDLGDAHASWSRFALRRSRENGRYFRARPLPAADREHFLRLAGTSRAAAEEIDSPAQARFDIFLQRHFKRYEELLPHGWFSATRPGDLRPICDAAV